MKPIIQLLFLIFIFNISAQSQTNLLRNPGFETIQNKQFNWAKSDTEFSDNMKYWSSPTKGSPDIFSNDMKSSWAFRVQGLGKDTAHSGNNMIGITTFVHSSCNKEHKREYLHTRLTEPLKIGKTYHISFWMKSPHRTLRSSHLGILFSKHDFFHNTKKRIIAQPQMVIDTVLNLEYWTKIELSYTPDDNYEIFTLGNFTSNKNTIYSAISPKPSWFAYYYIDDISIVELIPEVPDIPILASKSPSPLDNIYFEFDEAILLPSSFPELDKLVLKLQTYPTAKVEIHGHTDHEGSIDYNIKLSEARAQAVVNYLIEKGIEATRLSAKGFGEEQPLSESDKARNRRVEFLIQTQSP